MFMRPYRGWTSPRREMERLRREMNRMFSAWPTRSPWRDAPSFPAINVWTDDDNSVVTAELPGVTLNDLEIAVEDDTLTLRGNRQPDELEEGVVYHRQERRYGSFNRSLRLPFRVDAQKVEATLLNGVLTISLPRAELDKPKKITVKVG
jgi:HSP20 family protein